MIPLQVREEEEEHQIILKKGIDPKTADQARLDWVLQGASPNHPIVLKLLLKGA